MTEQVDMVNNPPHYVSDSGVECIDVIRHLPASLANCVKYVWRFEDKWNPEEDLEKAWFYWADYCRAINDVETSMFFTIATMLGGQIIVQEGLLLQHAEWASKEGKPQAGFFRDLLHLLEESTLRLSDPWLDSLGTGLFNLRDRQYLIGLGVEDK